MHCQWEQEYHNQQASYYQLEEENPLPNIVQQTARRRAAAGCMRQCVMKQIHELDGQPAYTNVYSAGLPLF